MTKRRKRPAPAIPVVNEGGLLGELDAVEQMADEFASEGAIRAYNDHVIELSQESFEALQRVLRDLFIEQLGPMFRKVIPEYFMRMGEQDNREKRNVQRGKDNQSATHSTANKGGRPRKPDDECSLRTLQRRAKEKAAS